VDANTHTHTQTHTHTHTHTHTYNTHTLSIIRLAHAIKAKTPLRYIFPSPIKHTDTSKGTTKCTELGVLGHHTRLNDQLGPAKLVAFLVCAIHKTHKHALAHTCNPCLPAHTSTCAHTCTRALTHNSNCKQRSSSRRRFQGLWVGGSGIIMLPAPFNWLRAHGRIAFWRMRDLTLSEKRCQCQNQTVQLILLNTESLNNGQFGLLFLNVGV